MDKIILLNKKIGQTPFQCIEEFRNRKSELRKVKLGYAGRLDPMAEGLLLVMVGEECKKREKYQKLDKEYEADILFGISTDTYDILGIITEYFRVSRNHFSGPVARPPQCVLDSKYSLRRAWGPRLAPPVQILKNKQNSKINQVENVISQFKGRIKQKLPPYSAYRIGEHSMYKLAREGRLDLRKLPEKEVEIWEIKVIGKSEIRNQKLEALVYDRISKVKGDFRQEEIINCWREYFKIIKKDKRKGFRTRLRLSIDGQAIRNDSIKYPIVRLKIHCSSGTYIRSLANDLGIKIGIPAMLLNLKRTRIGEYKLLNYKF